MSEWQPTVVRLDKIERHPQADTLEMATVLGGYTCIFKEGRFKEGDLASFIPVDTVVSDNPEFDYLQNHKRIRASRIRGIFSLGVLAAPPPDAQEGDSVIEYYGLKKFEYEEEIPDRLGGNEAPPNGLTVPYYDLKGLRQLQFLLNEGEEVVISEKIEGCNFAVLHDGNRLWVKSRNHFKREDINNLWWKAAYRYKLADKLAKYPNKAFFCELYGQVGGFPYDCVVEKNIRHPKIRFFDVCDAKTLVFADWAEMSDMVQSLELETAPVLYQGQWKPGKELWHLAEGQSTIGSHIREGFVVRPVKERVDIRHGRVVSKLKGEGYYLKKK